MKYEVLVNGKSVWSEETDDDVCDRNVFPPQYRGRPDEPYTDADGTVHEPVEGAVEVTLITDDDVIAVNRSKDARTPEPQVVITGSGGGVQEDAVGKGG